MKKILFILVLCINLLGQERIVTLSPSINEIVFALGAGKDVVANTNYCDFPEESKAILKIGGYNNISLEKILETKPTVVIGQDYDEKLNSNLKALGIKTLSYKTNTISSIKNTINELGNFFDKKEKAKELTSNIDNALLSVNAIVENKKILIVISPKKSLSNQIYVTGNFLYFEDIIKASGNKNAYYSENQAQPVVNTEKIIGMNPDIIILLTPFLDGKKQEQDEIIKAWKQLPINASKDDNGVVSYKIYNIGTVLNTISAIGITSTIFSTVITRLTPETAYSLQISAVDAAKNESEKSELISFTTLKEQIGVPGGTGNIEDFENIPEKISSYTTVQWNNNSIDWTANGARTDLSIQNGKAITIKEKLTSSEIQGGISSLTITTKLSFSGSAGNFVLKINGNPIAQKIPYGTMDQVITTTIDNINVFNDFTITLENEKTSNRVTIDDLSWTSYTLSTNEVVNH